MLKLYFLLYYEFFKIGIFAIGGGYAALPFLYFIQAKYNWFTVDELTNMIAVSNITPGPIGINMATYTGYTTAGLIGSILSTTAIVSGPFFFVLAVVKAYNKFKSLKAVNDIFLGLRPAACALLTMITLQLLVKLIYINGFNLKEMLNIDHKALILFLLMIAGFSFIKKNPLLVIVVGAIGGIIIKAI